jgi:hypothetical protein
MRIKGFLASMAVAGAMAFSAPVAQSASLPVNAGWVDDITFALRAPSIGSEWTFDLPNGGTFSITDDFLYGDVYTVTDATLGLLITTTPGLIPDAWTMSLGDPNGYIAWADPDYSKGQIVLGPGSYSLTIASVADILFPAGFYVRVDAPVVPAPAALAIFGMGLAGLVAVRRRRDRA